MSDTSASTNNNTSVQNDAKEEKHTTGILVTEGPMKNWYCEVNQQWPGQAMSVEVEEVLFDQHSQYQHVQVFKTSSFGNVLVLDGVIQVTEKDEMSYQEMITHLPMFSHPNPEYVLVIGGGDGGVIREVVRHPSVKEVVICEIDQMVIDSSKKFLPGVAIAWDNPKVKLHCGDGAEFMKRPENLNRYDVIITDSSDPVGPAQALFEMPFYECMSKALRAGGKVCTQAECIWIHLDMIKGLKQSAARFFANVEYASTQTPTYPCGQIGFLLCTKAWDANDENKPISSRKPVREVSKKIQQQLRYYTPEIHQAAFVLPAFADRAINA